MLFFLIAHDFSIYVPHDVSITPVLKSSNLVNDPFKSLRLLDNFIFITSTSYVYVKVHLLAQNPRELQIETYVF